MTELERRQFLKSSTWAGASLIGTSKAWAGANNRIRVALIGAGGRGRRLVEEILENEGVELAVVCDVDERRALEKAEQARKISGRRPRIEKDLRRIMDDSSIDAVTIATCNHWHALAGIWACQAGKHVYVEKPIAHNVWEGRKLVEAARKYDRIVQGGTNRRSSGSFRRVAQLVRDGVIGRVYWARCEFPRPRDPLGFKPAEPPPSWLDWNLWLGPAPEQAFHRNLVHYNWHWFWDFGNGEMGNNGIHIIDVCRWIMGQEVPVRAHSGGGRFGENDQAETPNTHRATFEFENGSLLTCDLRNLYSDHGRVVPRRALYPEPRLQWMAEFTWDLYGTEGYIHMKHRIQKRGAGCDYQVFLGRNKKAEPNPPDLEGWGHYQNFVNALRAGDRSVLTADIEVTHRSGIFCELANISHRVGREVRFDPVTETIPGDEEANRLLRREYRKPFEVPEKV